jgi:prepilin-type N-terminal cleavage/methylation domain-containing protein
MSLPRGFGTEMRAGRRPEGFTLVEVLVSMALMALTMLAIAPLFASSMKSNATGEDFSVLNALAKQQLEQVLQYAYSDPRLAVPAGSTFSLVNQGGTSKTYTGALYANELPTSVTVAGSTVTYPYYLAYSVQDYTLASLPPSGTTFDLDTFQSAAVTDTDTGFTASGFKFVTVYVASSRSSLQGSGYKAGVLPVTFNGKQIRLSAYKTQ